MDTLEALERQARRLEAACTDSPGDAGLEKELRATLLALGAAPGKAGDGELGAFLDAIRG